jgi:hypothetical protein
MALNLQNLVSRMIIGNLQVPFIIVMNPNPQNFRVNSSKSFTQAQTLGSFVYEHWGNKPDVIQCVGWTQRKVGTAEDFLNVDFQILRLQQIFKLDKERISSFYKMFTGASLPSGTNIFNLPSQGVKDPVLQKKVSSFRTLGQSFIIYRYAFYMGFFTDFVYSEQSERPRIYDYNFNFVVTFSSTDYIASQLLTNFPTGFVLGMGSSIQSITKAAGVI